ncbi:MAG: hypothetical protein OEZ58_17950 [Gammaproteobacteria bacterium]|nr:hypothetical protein [Gammaproteobacteria bacterium]MDH5730875.1 hypothetical protein [Gammaproteobacteria bacterium]
MKTQYFAVFVVSILVAFSSVVNASSSNTWDRATSFDVEIAHRANINQAQVGLRFLNALFARSAYDSNLGYQYSIVGLMRKQKFLFGMAHSSEGKYSIAAGIIHSGPAWGFEFISYPRDVKAIRSEYQTEINIVKNMPFKHDKIGAVLKFQNNIASEQTWKTSIGARYEF